MIFKDLFGKVILWRFLNVKCVGERWRLGENQSVATCEYCGTQQTLPKLDNEKKLALFSRANNLRIKSEFDKAAGIYESIIAEFRDEAEVTAAQRKIELERQTTETKVARREAERELIRAQTEAQAAKMAGFAEAEVMAAKGITEKEYVQADVQKAFAEGIGNMGTTVVPVAV